MNSTRVCVLLASGWLLQTGVAAADQQIVNGTAPAVVTPSTTTAPTLSSAGDVTVGRYRLQQGDTFELIFPFVTGFNQTVTVQRDGFVSLRLVGDVKAAGQTVPE